MRTAFEGTTLEQLYSLGAEEKNCGWKNRLIFNHNWTLLEGGLHHRKGMHLYGGGNGRGILERDLKGDAAEYYMQRFLDVQDQEGRGLAIANDGNTPLTLRRTEPRLPFAEAPHLCPGQQPGLVQRKGKLSVYGY